MDPIQNPNPVPEVDPTPIAPASNPTTPASTTPASAPASTAAQPQAGKKPIAMIIAIIVAAVILVGGGAVAAWMLLKKTPEQIALEATTNAILAENSRVSGSVKLEPTESGTGIESIVLELSNEANADFEGASKLTVSVDITSMGTYNIDFGSVILSDGNIYLSVSGLQDIYDQFEPLLSLYSSSIEGFDVIEEFIAEVDGVWWEINLSDLLEEFGVQATIANQINELYTCAIDELSNLDRAKIADLYKENDFITAKEYTGDKIKAQKGALYEISFDGEKTAKFANAFIKSDVLDGIFGCNTELSAMKAEIPEATKENFSGIEDFDYIAEIADGNYTRLYYSQTESGLKATLDLNIEHPDSVKINKPENSKSIIELITSVKDALDGLNIPYEQIFSAAFSFDTDYDFDFDYEDYDFDYDFDYEDYDIDYDFDF